MAHNRPTGEYKEDSPMKITQVAFALGALALSMLHTSLQAMELGPETRMYDQPKSASMPSAPSGATMCAKADAVVFSCPLSRGKKIVSMCAAGDIAGGHGRFYYAYGQPGSPELSYPADRQQADGAFARTHLGFAGNTGGYAYTFVNNGYKYVVYSISGE